MSDVTLSDRQIADYLDRLGLDPESFSEAPIDKALLDRLIDAHQTHVPFQTVSVNRLEQQPSLELDDLYKKIVIRGWGGYCFELNKMFEALLRALGYDARPIYSRSVRGRDGRMPINHRAILVRLDDGSVAYADVGFGGPTPSGALLLEDGVFQEFESGTFIPVLVKPGHWKVNRVTRGSSDAFDDAFEPKTQTEIELYEFEVEDVDFELLNKALSSPGSLFRDALILNLRTPDGHKSLRDNMLTVRENGEKSIYKLEDDDELAKAISEHFGMKDILR